MRVQMYPHCSAALDPHKGTMNFGNTPKEITPEISAFCDQIVLGGQPEFLAITPVPGAQVLDCFPVVEEHVRRNGGKSCYGWRIWEWPGVLLEAEFHVVWCDSSGVLHDISPPPARGVSRLLFLPDPQMAYHGHQVPNVRHALSNDPNVTRYIDACDREFEFLNRGERAYEHGEIRIEDAEAEEWDDIQQLKGTALLSLTKRSMSAAKPTLTPDETRRARNQRKKRSKTKR